MYIVYRVNKITIYIMFTYNCFLCFIPLIKYYKEVNQSRVVHLIREENSDHLRVLQPLIQFVQMATLKTKGEEISRNAARKTQFCHFLGIELHLETPQPYYQALIGSKQNFADKSESIYVNNQTILSCEIKTNKVKILKNLEKRKF